MENIVNGDSESSTPMQKKDCFFFVQYGMCSFGKNCRYNHPPQEDSKVVLEEMTANLYANYNRKRPCKFYRAGHCKYGNYCGFLHSVPDAPRHYNYDGLPMRLGEKICSFYMRNHWCGYGAGCKFHHPELNYFVPQDYGQAHDEGTGSNDGGYYPVSVTSSTNLPSN